MSSKILSVQDSQKWRRQSKGGQPDRKRPAEPPGSPEFRGLPNRALITIVLTLSGFGLMAVYSASAPEALQSYQDSTVYLRRQAIALLIGVFFMFTISRFDYRKLKKFAWPAALVSLFLLLLTLVPHIGVKQMGAARWLGVGPFQFQPSELCKVSSIVLLSAGLSKFFWWHKQILLRILITVAMAGAVVKQPDLGSAMMIGGGLLSLLYVSGTNTFLLLSAIGGTGFMIWQRIINTPYQMARINSWIDPYSSPQKDGWNSIQSLYAIGSGGWFGVGFGRSLQKLYYLPVQHADFIFAVIAEEFGYLGCLVLISLFALFGYYGFKTALEARTLFGRFLAIGITSSICLQAMVNIMVTTGLLPVTGITLPFVSYGGTSLVITLSMVGILLSVSRDRGVFEDDDDLDAAFAPVR